MEQHDQDDTPVDAVAIPALHLHHPCASVPVLVLDVDGEVFELRPDDFRGTDYSWLTGQNPGYGFGSSPTLGYSLEDHRTSIRSFLAQVDPTTGYIEDT